MILQPLSWSSLIPKVHDRFLGGHLQDLLEMASGALHSFWLLKWQTFVQHFVTFILIQATPLNAVDIISGILGLSDTIKYGAILYKLCCLRENLETMETVKGWKTFTASLFVPKLKEKLIKDKAWQCLWSLSCSVGGWYFSLSGTITSPEISWETGAATVSAQFHGEVTMGCNQSEHPKLVPLSFEAKHTLSCQNHTAHPQKAEMTAQNSSACRIKPP